MLPFTRVLNFGNSVNKSLLDINFNSSTIGSTVIIDRAGHTFTKVGTGSASVVSDAVKGNVMQFSGSSYFITPMQSDISLSNIHFKMNIVFKSTISTENMLFCTGDYFSSGSIVGGLLLTIFNSSGTELFCTTDAGVFTRCIFNYTINTWRDLTFEWIPNTKTMIIYDNDSTTTIFSGTVSGGFGNGTNLSIGASYVRGVANANFQGLLQKIKIELIQN